MFRLTPSDGYHTTPWRRLRGPCAFDPTHIGPDVSGAALRVFLREVLRACYPPLRASYPPLRAIPQPGKHAVHSSPLVTWMLHPVTARSKTGLGTASTSWEIGHPATTVPWFFSIRLSSSGIRRSSSHVCLNIKFPALVFSFST